MGKATTPRSPPATEASANVPHMDPPPPYDAPSSRSSSAHSHDRLQPGQAGQQTQSHEAAPRQDKKKDEGGCLTFGEGASGCMVYGDHADGCLNYGDHSDGCLNYKSRDGCLLWEATGGGCLNFKTSKNGCCQCG